MVIVHSKFAIESFKRDKQHTHKNTDQISSDFFL